MAETFDQVNEYDPADTDPTNLMEVTDETRIGMHELTITEYNTATVPEISIGSLIEINGTLFKVNDTGGGTGMPVTVGGVADGTVYIELIPSGAAPNQILTPTFTATAPTWFDSKQGWYDATGTNRYIHYRMLKATASYTNKAEFFLKNNIETAIDSDGTDTIFRGSGLNVPSGGIISPDGTNTGNVLLKIRVVEIGDWNMDATVSVSPAHGVASGITNIRSITALIRRDANDGLNSLEIPDAAGHNAGYVGTIDNNNVPLVRIAGGQFDHVDYNSTSFNRGWIVVHYV